MCNAMKFIWLLVHAFKLIWQLCNSSESFWKELSTHLAPHVCLIALLCILDDLWPQWLQEPLAAQSFPMATAMKHVASNLLHVLLHLFNFGCPKVTNPVSHDSQWTWQKWLVPYRLWRFQIWTSQVQSLLLFTLLLILSVTDMFFSNKTTGPWAALLHVPSISFSSFAVSFWPGYHSKKLQWCYHHKHWSLWHVYHHKHFAITDRSDFQAAWLLARNNEYLRYSIYKYIYPPTPADARGSA